MEPHDAVAGFGAGVAVAHDVVIPVTCSIVGPNGCATPGRPFAGIDIDGDSNMDLSWYHAPDGAVSTWRLDRAGKHIGTVKLDLGAYAPRLKNAQPVGYVTLIGP